MDQPIIPAEALAPLVAPKRPADGTKNGGDRVTQQARAEYAVRLTTIVQLAQAGVSFTDIAKRPDIDMTPQGVGMAYRKALRDLPRFAAEEALAHELAIINRMQAAAMKAAIEGGLGAIDEVLKCVSLRAKLQGLFGAVKIDLRTDEQARSEVESVFGDLLALIVHPETADGLPVAPEVVDP